MTNPTSNFGWQMPTSTDLVTDLPADFETFGQAVDTSLADLKGGTTGQVLSKASNTDMDFTWVAQDDSNAIQNAIVDAKGDLIAASAADTPARLAVGTNGQVLTADSTASTGLAWATPASGGMTLLSTTTLSGATTNITGISGSYVNLFVSVIGLGVSSNAQITVKPNGSGAIGFQSTSKSNTTTADVVGGGITRIFSTDTISSGFAINNANFTIFDYASSNRHPFSGASIGYPGFYCSYVYGGGLETASAITSIEFGTTAGTFDAGTVKIYGVK